jgi:hypothetical protein
MSTLSGREMTKPGREYRITLFAKKFKEGDEFELNNGKKVKLVYDKEIERKILRKQTLDQLEFYTTTGQKLKLKDFKKNKEFGGKSESTTRIEEGEIISLRKQMNEIRKKTGKAFVPIKIKNKLYEVYEIEKTKGTPKSDFHFLDADGKSIVWISHKDGDKPSDFQQWGGISKVVPNTHSHKETKKFIHDLSEKFPKGLPKAANIIKEINDKILKKRAVYGDEYKQGGSRFNENNVQLVLQGPVKLVPQGNYYVLKANHINSNGEELKGDYDPTFTAQYRSDRGAPVKNARASIWPKAVEKRKNTIKLGKK